MKLLAIVRPDLSIGLGRTLGVLALSLWMLPIGVAAGTIKLLGWLAQTLGPVTRMGAIPTLAAAGPTSSHLGSPAVSGRPRTTDRPRDRVNTCSALKLTPGADRGQKQAPSKRVPSVAAPSQKNTNRSGTVTMSDGCR